MIDERDLTYTVEAWMYMDYGLKGNELTLFAIIYTFSRFGGDNAWYGSLKKVERITGATAATITSCYKKLEEKGMIKKEVVYVGKVKTCRYTALVGKKEKTRLDNGRGENASDGYDVPRQSNSLEQSAKNQVYFDARTRTFVPYGEEPKEKQPDDDPLKGLTGQERYYKQMELEMEQKRKAFAQSLMNPQTQSKEDEIIPLENPEPNPEPELKLQKNQVSNATLERVKFGNEIRQIMEHLDRKTHTEGRIVTVDTILALTKWLADGFRVEDIQRMISYKCKQWINDEKMKVWLIPSTLFGEKHFKEYMEQSAGYQDLEDECRRKYNYL